MKFLIGLSQEIIVIAVCLVVLVIIYGVPIYIIYRLIKRLIRYNAECKYRYSVYRQASDDLQRIEDELNAKAQQESQDEE